MTHTPKLNLQKDKVDRVRALAAEIVVPVQDYIHRHTTTTVERSALRLMGVDGADSDGIPTANLVVDQLRDVLSGGVTRPFASALVRTNKSVPELSNAVLDGFNLAALPLADADRIETKIAQLVASYETRTRAVVAERNEFLDKYGENEGSPLLYVIVATGNIYEDVKQAQAAAEQGADVVAVIRSTAQSLLDYVPYGATTEGFGGTFATQENFRIMREALDETSHKTERYIRLVNYCSGLCMPEIAAMGSIERLDMMLNDSMYGILFRDINPYRTFIDQNFSRKINAFADIIINTGEDNYLTTSDAYDKAYTVTASQILNERLALDAGMEPRLIGLGHAFEMNPNMENGFMYELAHAQLARDLFPECPLKYMPPTKYMTGDIFQGTAMNTLFSFVSKATGQSIHLLGMITEAIHTPFMQDRYLAIKNARYVMNNMVAFGDEVTFPPDGMVVRRANQVLDETVEFLGEVAETGLFDAVAAGMFADVKRPPQGGKGLDEVIEKGPNYSNPFDDFLTRELGSHT